MTPVLSASLFGLAAAATGLATLVAVRFAAGYTRAQAPLFAAFAAGLLIALAILHLIPEALAMTGRAPILVLAGFGAGFLMQRGIEAWPGESAPGRGLAFALAPVIAIGLHSSVDGLVYAVTFSVDFFTGLSAALGLLVHEVPEAIICFVLLQRAGLSDLKSFIWAFVAAGLTTLVFAAGTAPFAATLAEPVLGDMFAVIAGLMLHVGATHMLSHAGEAGWMKSTPLVILGAVAAIGLTGIKSEIQQAAPAPAAGTADEPGAVPALNGSRSGGI